MQKWTFPLAILIAVLLFHYSRQGKDVTPVGLVRSVMPWSVKAESAAKRLLSGDSGTNVASTIQRIGHPTGQDPKLRDVRVAYRNGVLESTITVRWTGGFMGGNYETTVLWRCSEERDLGIKIVSDDAPFGIASDNFRQLESYFETNVYPVLKHNLGEAQEVKSPETATE